MHLNSRRIAENAINVKQIEKSEFMKTIRFFSKMLFVITVVMAVAISAKAQSYESAQSYKLIKTVQGDGSVISGNGFRQRFTFQGDKAYYYMGANLPVCVYKYSHQSNGNSVYYQQAYDYAYNRYVLNESSYLLVSPDKELINVVSTNGYKHTSVYQLDKNNGIEEMIR